MTQRRINDPPTPRLTWVIRLSISSQRYLGNQLRGHLSAWCALVEGLSPQQIATGLASEWPPMTNNPAKGLLPEITTTFRVGEIGVSLPPWKGRFSIGAELRTIKELIEALQARKIPHPCRGIWAALFGWRDLAELPRKHLPSVGDNEALGNFWLRPECRHVGSNHGQRLSAMLDKLAHLPA